MPNLITLSDIRNVHEISMNFKETEATKHIERSQVLDLKPILGDDFYNDFMKYVNDPLSSKYIDYQKLFLGEEFGFTGIKTVLCYFAYYRILQYSNSSATQTGLREKDTSQSRYENSETIKKGASVLADARQLQTEFEKFLMDNRNIYTLYKQEENNQIRTGIRFFGIKKY